MFNLATLLEDSVTAAPDHLAVISGDNRLTYREVNAVANRVANSLSELHIGLGDKVALSCPNLWYFPAIYYGILKVGATVVPLNVMLKAHEIAYHLEDSDAKAYFCYEGSAELPMGEHGRAGFEKVGGCEHFIVITPDDDANFSHRSGETFSQFIADRPDTFESVSPGESETAVILYTSGTTGQPKGAELSHFNMVMNARLADTMYKKSDYDVHLVALPLFHSYGQSVQMNAGFYCRSTLVLLPRFTPESALRAMETENVTLFSGVPTMYWSLLNYQEAVSFDLPKIASNLRLCKSGGSALSLEVLRGFEEKFNVRIIEGYGLSETSPVAAFNKIDMRKLGSIGLPVWGIRIRVVDSLRNEVPFGEPGEILISGHCVMKGYYKRPEDTAQTIREGWLHTGDMGYVDEDGYLFITDRIKDMIVRGGYNVYPREIEEFLMIHPAVSLCAVIGIPCPEYGEEIKAVVVLKEGLNASEDELVEWCRSNLASYKYPRVVEFRASLPMTSTGKILKRQLREG